MPAPRGADIGCSKTPPPTPAPGTDIGETITGRERFGWDQPASDAAELATFRYAIYVDGVRSIAADVSCGSTAGTGGFPCSGRLPAMSPGTHTLELAAFFDIDGILESAKSPPLRVTVTGLTSAAIAVPLQPGEIITSLDGVRLTTDTGRRRAAGRRRFRDRAGWARRHRRARRPRARRRGGPASRPQMAEAPARLRPTGRCWR